MAKPTKYATPICLVLSVLAIIGVIIGFLVKNPIWPILLLLPAVIYEFYRTEGRSTKWSSGTLLFLIIAEIICLLLNIKFDLADYLNQSHAYIGYTYLPLGELTIIFPMAMAALSIILFVRTNGIYTKWLAVIIFASMLSTVYIIDPNGFQELLRNIVPNILRYF